MKSTVNIITFNTSMIFSGKYEAKKRLLTIDFKNGSRYQYEDVPEEIWYQMKVTPEDDLNKYFIQNIREKFKTTKL